MKSDEGIFKMLSKSSIIRNQYENVSPTSIKKFKGHPFDGLFFINIKMIQCQKDIVENHLKTQV